MQMRTGQSLKASHLQHLNSFNKECTRATTPSLQTSVKDVAVPWHDAYLLCQSQSARRFLLSPSRPSNISSSMHIPCLQRRRSSYKEKTRCAVCFRSSEDKRKDLCAGLGNALGLLLSKEPSCVRTTAAARVLQLLMEHQEHSISNSRPLAAYLSKLDLERHLLESLKERGFIDGGILKYLLPS